ncbi:MAG: hypothetical protein ABIQ89_04380 [Candidatus Saccharimonadales bacterium]
MSSINHRRFPKIAGLTFFALVSFLTLPVLAHAQSVPVTATVLGTPPTTQAVILQPTNGQVFATTPLVVSGTCEPSLLVRIFNNGQLAGSIVCSNDSDFIVNVTLQVGQNVLTAFNYDFQDQPGPNSPAVTVTVIPPEVQTDPLPSGIINEAGVINTSGRGRVSPLYDEDKRPSQEFIFEGTFFEPIAKGFGIEPGVAPKTNQIIATIMNGAFVAILVLPVMAFSCFRFGWWPKSKIKPKI